MGRRKKYWNTFLSITQRFGVYGQPYFLFHKVGVCPLLVRELILGWVCLPLKKKETKMWRAAPLCLSWAIWMERNKVVFEDECFSFDRLKSFFSRSLCAWTTMIPDVDSALVRCILCII